jgi:hypothetical protein
LSSQWSLFFWLSHQYPIYIPLLPHSCYMPYPLHPPLLDHSNYTWRRVHALLVVFNNFFNSCTEVSFSYIAVLIQIIWHFPSEVNICHGHVLHSIFQPA